MKRYITIYTIFIVILLTVTIASISCSKPQRGKLKRSSYSSEIVKNSSWDGSVSQVKSWLKKNAKDPKSIEYIEWSKVHKTSDGGFMVRVKYRAKNSFGGYVIGNKVFFLSSSGIVKRTANY